MNIDGDKELPYQILAKYKGDVIISVEVYSNDNMRDPLKVFSTDETQQGGFLTFAREGSVEKSESYIVFDRNLDEGTKFREVSIEQPEYEKIAFNVNGSIKEYPTNLIKPNSTHDNILYKRVASENNFANKYYKPANTIKLDQRYQKNAIAIAPFVPLSELEVDSEGNITKISINSIKNEDAENLGKLIFALPQLTFDQRNFLDSRMASSGTNINRLTLEGNTVTTIGFNDIIPDTNEWQGLNNGVKTLRAPMKNGRIESDGKPVAIRTAFPNINRFEPNPTKTTLRVPKMGKIAIVPNPSIKQLYSLEFTNNKRIAKNVVDQLYYIDGEFSFIDEE